MDAKEIKQNRAYVAGFLFLSAVLLLMLVYVWIKGDTWQSNASLHTLMEAVAMVLAVVVGVFALVSFYSRKSNILLFVGVGFLGTAILDGYHILAASSLFLQQMSSGAASFVPWSWLVARLFLSVFMLLSFVFFMREKRLGVVGRYDRLQEVVDAATFELNQQVDVLRDALRKEQARNEQQQQFVVMASHEFRTPLAIVDGSAQRIKRLASKNRLTPEIAIEKVDIIRSSIERMIGLIDTTLDAASLDDGKIKLEIGSCNIKELVTNVCERQQSIAAQHNITWEMGELPETIQADDAALERVFTNILSNAVKYAKNAPEIVVHARTEGDKVIVSVRDHGIGIDASELNKIGERFFRASTSTGIPGTGIGLNLVKNLLELHGGGLDVESEKGEGSLFIVSLPILGPMAAIEAEVALRKMPIVIW